MKRANRNREYGVLVDWLLALPLNLRDWRSGIPRAILENTGALLLPEMLPIKPEDRLLEIGCGGGILSAALASRANLINEPTGLQLGHNLHKPEQLGVQLVQGVPIQLPFEANAFTVILVGHQLRYWNDDTVCTFLREAWRVLDHNGVLIIWEVAPSRSAAINKIWHVLLSNSKRELRLRRFAELGKMGHEANFAWIQTLRMQPILWPPGPRVAVLMRKEYYDKKTVDLESGVPPSH